MKRICTVCHRMSVDGNLWCQEPDCPAGNMPLIFEYGESLGDIQVRRLLRSLRCSAIYEAQRGEEKVLLKVAHNNCQDQLRLEARTLVEMAQKTQHAMLPVLLPAYQQADPRQRPYGKTVFRGETKYYSVFAYAEGEFLHDMLLKNPQPWYQHAAWMAIMLADVIAFMHIQAKRLHLNLNPDAIYVRVDKGGVPRPMLLDLGLLGDQNQIDPAWVTRYAVPAYTAPEVLTREHPVSHAADIYGLGLVLYEMLAGHPAYEYAQRRDADVRQDVITRAPEPLSRTDLAKEIHEIVQQAIHRTPQYRQQDVRVFAKMLRTKFGEVPAEKKRNWNRRFMTAAVMVGLLVTVWIMLSALIG